MSALQLRNRSTSKGRGQKSALSMFPGTYCCCAKGARRSGGGGGTGEEAVPGQADTLWVSLQRRILSHLHICIQTDTYNCNTAHGPAGHGDNSRCMATEGPLKPNTWRDAGSQALLAINYDCGSWTQSPGLGKARSLPSLIQRARTF